MRPLFVFILCILTSLLSAQITDYENINNFDLNKNRLPKQIPEYEEKIASYLKREKIKLKEEEEIVMLFREVDAWSNEERHNKLIE